MAAKFAFSRITAKANAFSRITDDAKANALTHHNVMRVIIRSFAFFPARLTFSLSFSKHTRTFLQQHSNYAFTSCS
jgi:hypothetical protein